MTYIWIILLIIVIVMVIYKARPEHFTMYKRNPNSYYDTGSDPLTFYEYPIYKEPYMYPQQFYSSYPTPYLTYHPDSL